MYMYHNAKKFKTKFKFYNKDQQLYVGYKVSTAVHCIKLTHSHMNE